jgi:hypothetical protein
MRRRKTGVGNDDRTNKLKGWENYKGERRKAVIITEMITNRKK